MIYTLMIRPLDESDGPPEIAVDKDIRQVFFTLARDVEPSFLAELFAGYQCIMQEWNLDGERELYEYTHHDMDPSYSWVLTLTARDWPDGRGPKAYDDMKPMTLGDISNG